MRGLFTRLLTHQGYRVQAAENGHAALAALAANPFDLVIVDLTMPDMTGIEVLQRMRAGGATMPVILTSGYLEPNVPFGDFADFIAKPFDAEALVGAIERALAAAAVPDPLTQPEADLSRGSPA